LIAEVERLFENNNLKLIESRPYPEADAEYWHSTVVDGGGSPISGGFGTDQARARRIAVAELLERFAVRDLAGSANQERQAWGLDVHPTACGFAGGFNLSNTVKRSTGEALERWAMSLWIDEGFMIPQLASCEVVESLDSISKYFASQFDEVLFFLRSFKVKTGTSVQSFVVAQTMGLKDGGIFPGSSAQFSEGSYWQHALLESVRHLLGVKNNPVKDIFPNNKVAFFAQNAGIALEQIHKAQRTDWPEPKISLQRVLQLYNGQFFVARTIIDGWKNWSEGPLERFLY
jgi:hypothetical protein